MGVRGLTTYIAKHSDRYLEDYELKDCTIVVDGNNIACQLYKWVSKCSCAFGGDYDKYADCVRRFFSLLRKCEVTPLVLLDGGYETRKLSTVRVRMKKKLSTAKSVTPVTQTKLKSFPLFMKDVFKDVMRELEISFAQCEFEADAEIAAIARRLGCPVLSYDSDFYIFDVLYIPLSSVILEAAKCKSSAGGNAKYCVKCKIYRIETFLNSFGGLDKSLLPVLATVLGNDYIEKRVLTNFLSQIKVPKGKKSGTERFIIAILGWLRNETVESAVFKILNRLKINKRPLVRKLLQESISGYTTCSSELLSYLCKLDEVSVGVTADSSPSDIIRMVEHSFSEVEDGEVQEEDDVKSEQSRLEDQDSVHEECCESEEEEEEEEEGNQENDSSTVDLIPDTSLPHWFRKSYQCGNLPPSFINMLFLKTHFLAPQVENFNYPFSHKMSMPILSVLFGLLTSGNDVGEHLKCLAYSQRQLEYFNLLPVDRTTSVEVFPSLENIPDLSVNVTKCIIYDTVEITSSDIKVLDYFPDDWKIFMIALIYWARNISDPPITSHHIHALLFSIILLNLIDKHIGYYRTRKSFLKDNGNHLKKITQVQNVKELISSPVSDEITHCTDNIITKAISDVSRDDCLLIFESILPYHAVDESLKSRAKLFSLDVVHAFAQFQSCLQAISDLNALLSFPFYHCEIAKFYSGTVVYNAYINFKKRSNVEYYIPVHLLHVPSLFFLYRILVKTVSYLLPDLFIINTEKKRGKKKKNKSKNTETVEENREHFNEESEPDEILEFLKNNRFGALLLKT